MKTRCNIKRRLMSIWLLYRIAGLLELLSRLALNFVVFGVTGYPSFMIRLKYIDLRILSVRTEHSR